MRRLNVFLVASTFIIGCIATYFCYSFSENLALKDAEQGFKSVSITRIGAIKEKLQDTQGILLALKAFFDSSDDVTKQDFSNFSNVLTKSTPEVSSLSWYEASSNSDLDRNSSEQYALKYHYSYGFVNTPMIDVKSLVNSIIANDNVNSISMNVSNEKLENSTITFSLPIFSGKKNTPLGFLVMNLDPYHLIVNAIAPLPSARPVALSISNNGQVLAVFNPDLIKSLAESSSSFGQLRALEEVEVANSNLEVHSSSTIKLFYSYSYLSELVLIIGIIITLLLSYIVHLSVKRHKQVVDLVEKKTDDLKHAHKLILTQAKHLKSKAKNKQRFAEIKHALQNGEMSLYYQPKVNMRTGKVFGAEGLIRWNHPTKGLIPPLEFIPLISGTKLDCEIGNWVIEQGVLQLDAWQKQGIKLELSVNITSYHLQSDGFVNMLAMVLAKYPDVDTNLLQLEIVESNELGDHIEVGKIITECRDSLNIQMALDDFGTGYSSLAHLRNLPVKVIKIDQTFTRDMLDDPSDYAIVDGVIGLADSFNCDVIAEGVETTAHGLMLLITGCENAQGYGIAKPMPAPAFYDWHMHYTPNQEWIRCASQTYTAKENRIKLCKLIISEWKNTFITNIQSSPSAIQHWPIMNRQHSHYSNWFKRSLQTQLFEQQWLVDLDAKHEKLHVIAENLRQKYEEGNIKLARDGLADLQTAFDDIKLLLVKEVHE